MLGFFGGEKTTPVQKQKHHHFNKMKNELPTGYNQLFAGSGECLMCHNQQVNAQGESVSIISDWRSSMMAHSSKDPFWRAKVSHETLVNPGHAQVLEDVCTKCHAPVGHFNAHHNGQEYYSIDEMKNDPLALDGVSCTVCHQITDESLGNYSGNMILGTSKQIWGPFENPFAGPMINHTGYTPVYGPHIKDSRLCASCHTLITNTVDLSGNHTGDEFVEQAIYQEWKNSDFPALNISCQTCHVPEISDTVVVSSMPPWLGGRSPFGQHHLAGANVFMLKLMKENMDDLGVTATEAQMDSTISRAKRMLQQQSLNLQLAEVLRTEDTLFVDVSVENMAGHKFPSGYPSRRAFVELFVLNAEDDTIFHSGQMTGDYNLIHENPAYELHYNMIDSEEKVQIYEMVMGDVNYEPTTVLERAYVHLKDNRIPPHGFTSTHISYDTVEVAGNALNDEDFNKISGVEGSGKDIIHYHVPVDGESGALRIFANVYYQTVTDKWLQNMFTYSADEIDIFKEMYQQADRQPVKVAFDELISLSTWKNEKLIDENFVYPNPTRKFINLDFAVSVQKVTFYNLNGVAVLNYSNNSNSFLASANRQVQVPGKKGIYLIEVITSDGKYFTQKVLVN
jgi:hypothetical protein